ncbi:ferripyoverdine/pyocin S3 receptor FpvA [Acinetobacter puyangensis]|uniref:Outer-membrane receptor for ferric coprogen and ferric-rhodotorulic acid n=1 Tax=Acinetobacter puyangensis TaxID=1096779 RepID=A0A240ECA7_9GAMM|nr:TonB-dependent receptor [Acinetobacter puyangensis]SNX46348.1 outer-membrane receptor for ferric coprogen and ferric-rhodotorulic acid [Acinetobacter puyangensis]
MFISQLKPLNQAIQQLFIIGVMGLGQVATIQVVQANTVSTQYYQISAGSLDAALIQFASQAGVELSFEPESIQSLKTNGLKGNYSVSDGFNTLLAPHQLQAQQTATGYKLLAQTKAQARDMGQLKPIDVTVSGLARANNGVARLPVIIVMASDNSASEGTNTYKAKSSRSATKLDLTLKETPQSVSVITRDQIEQRGLTDINEILKASPGVTVGKFRSDEIDVYSRGFYVSNQQIDGIPLISNAPATDSFFLDRVEVIKGASGLTGSTGNPSATVNMIRKKPSKEFSANVSASYGSWNNLRQEIDVSIPLTTDGSIRSRVMAARTDKESFIDYYQNNNIAAMTVIEADLGENTVASVGYQYQDNQPRGTTYTGVPYWYADGSESNLPRSYSMAAKWGTISQRNKTIFADIQHTFANSWLIKGAVSHNKSEQFDTRASSFGFPNPSTGTGMDTIWATAGTDINYKSTSYDLYATGPFQLFNRRHDLVLGYSHFNTDTVNYGLSAVSDDSYTIEDYRSYNGNIPKSNYYKNGNNTKNYIDLNSTYTTLRLNLADPLKVILGARYTDYKQTTEINYSTYSIYSASTETTDALTPYFGVLYDINDQFTAYASYTDMFTPSSYKDRNGKYLNPQIGESYEFGIKSSIFEDKLLFSTAAFWTKIKDVAIEDTEYNDAMREGITNGTVQTAYVASGKGLKVEGFEIEAIGKITDNWNLTAGYTYVNSISSVLATTLINIPQNQFKLYTNYTLPETLFTGADRLTVGLGVNWQDDISLKNVYGAPANAANNGVVTQKSYYLVGASASYKFNDYFSATLNANNLLDKKYYQNLGTYGGYYGDPRNAVLTLRMKW